MQSLQNRQCRMCQQVFPATDQYFYRARQTSFQSYCKSCSKRRATEHVQAKNPEGSARFYAQRAAAAQRREEKARRIEARVLAAAVRKADAEARKAARGMKVCGDCHCSFPRTAEFFARDASYCRTCGQARLQKAILQAKTRRGTLLSHRTCSHCGETKSNSPEFFYAGASNTCKECWKARTRRDHYADPLRRRARTAKRRAKLLQAGGTHGPADIRRQFAQQKGKCYWCQAVLQVEGEDKYHVDHLIALAKGGTNGPENIVCACRACNGAKAAKMPWEFNGRLL